MFDKSYNIGISLLEETMSENRHNKQINEEAADECKTRFDEVVEIRL